MVFPDCSFVRIAAQIDSSRHGRLDALREIAALLAVSICAALLLAPLAAAQTPNQPFQLLDINPGAGSSFADRYFTVGTDVFFHADDGLTGIELWKTDGTTAGTVFLKDIDPGAAGSFPDFMAELNGSLFFRASEPVAGDELWKSDGTTAGTVLAADINPGPGFSNPLDKVELNGALLFRADDGTHGFELFATDGTGAGTVLLKDIQPGGPFSSGSPGQLTQVNGVLFFVANDGTNGSELWMTDGTTLGTVMVKDINSGGSSGPKALTNLNGTLLFHADDGTNGRELWKSDGTTAGTVLVKDINPGSGDSISSSVVEFATMNGSVFFRADDSVSGLELWKSDGTPAGTGLLRDINIGPADSAPFGNVALRAVNGTLFAAADDGVSGLELWKSDGTFSGTVLVKDIESGAGDSSPALFADSGGALFFRAFESATGRELWRSDGTTASTLLVMDINPGSANSDPNRLADSNGTLFFSANDGTSGTEPWVVFAGPGAPPGPYLVDSTSDTVDASLTDGICADAVGDCTLRAAVMQANARFGPDEIEVPAGLYVLTIPGVYEDASATGDLDVADDLVIRGAGSGADPLTNTVIQGGDPNASPFIEPALEIPYASGTVAVSISQLRFDTLSGVQNWETLDVRDTAFVGLDSSGLANQPTGRLTARDVLIQDSLAGVFNQGVLQLIDSALLDNGISATRSVCTGGVSSAGSEALLLMANVSMRNSFSDPLGQCAAFGSLLVHDVKNESGSVAFLSNVTIDESPGDLAIVNELSGGGLSFVNSIVDGNCAGHTSLGHNVETGTGCFLTATGDQQNVPLTFTEDLAGPTPTLVPTVDTAVRDAGTNVGCSLTDQRGHLRPEGGICDVGAAEFGSAPACSNGLDDDGDGFCDTSGATCIDASVPGDPGCADGNDQREFVLKAGDILVAENGNRAVQRVDPVTGSLSLLTRGYGIASSFGLVVESDGDVLLSDSAGALFRIDRDSGIPALLSARGSLQVPRGIALEASGDIVVADRQLNGVVRVGPKTGRQTVVTTDPIFGNPEDVSVHPLTGDLLVTDPALVGLPDGVVEVDPTSGTVGTIYNSPSDPFVDPRQGAADSAGNLFVADSGVDSIVKLDIPSFGIQTYVAAPGTFNDSYGLGREASGDLILTRRSAGDVVRVDPVSGSSTTLATGLADPIFVAIVPNLPVVPSLPALGASGLVVLGIGVLVAGLRIRRATSG